MSGHFEVFLRGTPRTGQSPMYFTDRGEAAAVVNSNPDLYELVAVASNGKSHGKRPEPLPAENAAPAPAMQASEAFGYTTFPTQSAQSMEFHQVDWAGFVAMLKNPPRSADKAALPWLKLARFSGARTDKNCLRHDAAVEVVYGIELDYDKGTLAFDDAALLLDAAGIRCVVVTSPRYRAELQKLRIFAPLSRPFTGDSETLKRQRRSCRSGNVSWPEKTGLYDAVDSVSSMVSGFSLDERSSRHASRRFWMIRPGSSLRVILYIYSV